MAGFGVSINGRFWVSPEDRRRRLKRRVGGQPASHLWRLMRAVVLKNEMQIERARRVRVYALEEQEKLAIAVAPITLAELLADVYIERSEQRGGAVTLVVRRGPLERARSPPSGRACRKRLSCLNSLATSACRHGRALATRSFVADEPVGGTRHPNIVLVPKGQGPAEARSVVASRRSVEVRGYALTVLMVLACLFGLQWARPLLVPVLLGILVSYVLEPLVARLVQWRVPRGLAAPVVFLTILAALTGFGWAVSFQLAAAADHLPLAAHEVREAIQTYRNGAPGPVAKVQEAANELRNISGADAPAATSRPKVQAVTIEQRPFDLGDYLWAGSLSVTAFVGDAVVVLFLALYLLLAGDMFRRRLVEIAGPTLSQKKITLHILDAISLQISRYLFVRTVISGAVAVGTFFGFWAIGLGEPAAWGVAAGVLNVIPYLGPAVIIGASGVGAFVQFHTVWMAVLAAGLATVVTCLEAYALTPWLMSRTAEMNPAAVFVGLVFWGWLWGLPGLFLAVPILMVIKSTSDHVESLHPLATLLKQ
jgi:predicted PurR-regulated permease PerM